MAYTNTFIKVSADCPALQSVVPVAKGKRTPIHLIQYDLLTQQPYTYTHKELTFAVHVARNAISQEELALQRDALWDALFQKGHPCMRASSLPKRYGWGAHYDENGKIALYAMESEEYGRLVSAENIQDIFALRNKRLPKKT